MSRQISPRKRPADAQEAAWIADEDRFVLQQAMRKAAIRVKGGRARPIDWLAVTLAVIDPERNSLDDDVAIDELEVVDPIGLFERLDEAQAAELAKGIDTYLILESSRSNLEFWNTMKTICTHRQQQSQSQPAPRGVSSVASDLDKLLEPKSLEELDKLERQIATKLSSNEPMDTDYWEHLLRSLLTYKARAKLRKVSKSIVASRLGGLRKQQVAEATALKARLDDNMPEAQADVKLDAVLQPRQSDERLDKRHPLDPDPLLRIRPEDKGLEMMSGTEFTQRLVDERQKVVRQGYVPGRVSDLDGEPAAKRLRTDDDQLVQPPGGAFDKEAARGLAGNEEIFATEERVTTKNIAEWSQSYRPRKPKYFNRVQLGYEWNKYNQTHYDHENPPPRVVQGYKFNIFYPDLVDKIKAPTYKIERENGRRRGQTLAPAGEDDTCVIRFIAGAPYEDVAFRIVDKEWDYSAKRERGFKSSFDKGILQLHLQFKKIYYRK